MSIKIMTAGFADAIKRLDSFHTRTLSSQKRTERDVLCLFLLRWKAIKSLRFEGQARYATRNNKIKRQSLLGEDYKAWEPQKQLSRTRNETKNSAKWNRSGIFVSFSVIIVELCYDYSNLIHHY